MTNSENFIGAMSSMYNTLASNRSYLDALNVFPVPDSDTGTNLCRTVKAGAEAVRRRENLSVNELLEKSAKAMLRSARGNSGVIISSLFKGFSDHMNKLGAYTASALCDAFDSALRSACRAINRPVYKGTVLSIVIACRDALAKNRFSTTGEAFSVIVPAANEALRQTGLDLEEAKRAGVVDSGAAGLTLMLGAVDSFLSRKSTPQDIPCERDERIVFKKHSPLSAPEYTYCTEFIVLRKNKKSEAELEKKLSALGNSVIVVGDSEIIKVHLHTNDPGRAMELSSPFGALADIKIDNMALQAEQKGGEKLEHPKRI